MLILRKYTTGQVMLEVELEIVYIIELDLVFTKLGLSMFLSVFFQTNFIFTFTLTIKRKKCEHSFPSSIPHLHLYLSLPVFSRNPLVTLMQLCWGSPGQ